MDGGTSLGGEVKVRPESWRPVFMWPVWLLGKQSQSPPRNHFYSSPLLDDAIPSFSPELNMRRVALVAL